MSQVFIEDAFQCACGICRSKLTEYSNEYYMLRNCVRGRVVPLEDILEKLHEQKETGSV